MSDGLKEALAKLAAAYGKGDDPAEKGIDPAVRDELIAKAVAAPAPRSLFPRHSWAPPLRRSIDYQSTPRKVLIFCDECHGVVDVPGAHDGDRAACDMEKVRQVMES